MGTLINNNSESNPSSGVGFQVSGRGPPPKQSVGHLHNRGISLGETEPSKVKKEHVIRQVLNASSIRPSTIISKGGEVSDFKSVPLNKINNPKQV